MTDDGIARRIDAGLGADEFLRRLASSDMDGAETMVRSALQVIDPRIELLSIGEKPRGIVREIELHWRLANGDEQTKIIPLPPVS